MIPHAIQQHMPLYFDPDSYSWSVKITMEPMHHALIEWLARETLGYGMFAYLAADYEKGSYRLGWYDGPSHPEELIIHKGEYLILEGHRPSRYRDKAEAEGRG